MINGADYYSRFLSGEKRAIEGIISCYWDGLVFYLFSIVGDMQKAEELATDTFIILYTQKPKFKGEGAFKTWLYAIGRNNALNHRRKIKRMYEVPLDEASDISDEECIEQRYIADEERIRLRRTINKLKPEYSQVLHLIYFEGFNNDETAQIMKKTKKQVIDLLYRAKAALKKQLEKEGYNYDRL